MTFSLDHLADSEFEEFCAYLLAELGLININWRKGTGLGTSPADRGRDIVCQLSAKDIDGTMYNETWFVECKHYRQGVPPVKLHSALAWATAERPDKLLFIASNFLSNPCKDFLEEFSINNRPPFRIKYWERPDLARLTIGKDVLLKKYQITPPKPLYRMSIDELNDPLVLKGLENTITEALVKAPAHPLINVQPFEGGGVYALYYTGNFPAYDRLAEFNRDGRFQFPIYIGRALTGSARRLNNDAALIRNWLYRRITEHVKSISKASNLKVSDFFCRYAVMAGHPSQSLRSSGSFSRSGMR
jgi:hypothetical protein